MPDSEGGLMRFLPLEVYLQFVNPSCSCWSLLCLNNEMQPWVLFFWARSWERVTFSALRAAGVTGSQRIRLSVSYGKSLVCCGCCFDFLVMCIFIHVCKNKHGLPLLPHRSLAIPCQQCKANVTLKHRNDSFFTTVVFWEHYKGYSGSGFIQKYFLHHH